MVPIYLEYYLTFLWYNLQRKYHHEREKYFQDAQDKGVF